MGPELLSLAVSAAVLLGGTAATYGYDRRTPLPWRIPSGICIGLAGFGLVGFALAMRFGLTTWVVALAGAAVTSPLAVFRHGQTRRLLSNDFKSAGQGLPVALSKIRARTILWTAVYAAGTILLWRVAERVMFVEADGIYTGASHNIGDLPFHLTVMSRFLEGGNFPPEHPSFAGAGFTYPFLTDFLGSMFVRAGMSARGVIVWSTLLMCVVLAALLYRWTLDLTGSQHAAFLAPVLALFSGGLGWSRFVVEVLTGDSGGWAALGWLRHDYTITADHVYRWGNLVTTLLVTQRGLLLGLPLALVVFHLWWGIIDRTDHEPKARRTRMIAAGLIAGMLPLIHAHSFAVVLAVGGVLALLSHDRWVWVPFFTWALALGLPQVWWVMQAAGVQGGTFFGWWVGWDRGDQNVLVFWLKNTGLFIPLIVVALLWRTETPLVPPRLRLFYLSFALCFVIPNLFRLAPWVWDNIKVLVYWFIASVPLVSLVLGRLMEGRRWRPALAGALLVTLTLAGALDVWRVASGAFQARIFDRAAIDFAAMVAETTEVGSRILHAPMPNHPVALSGRQSLMGYPGHVWSHGLDPGPRAADIRRMYAGGTEAPALLARYGIDYAVLGPAERSQMPTDERFFERYPRVAEIGGYRLYRIASDRKR